MGELYSITCKNRACRYHTKLRSGVGMSGFARMKNFEKAICEGEIENRAALKSLRDGARICGGGIYLCPKCQELTNDSIYYLIENLTYSPYGTPRYDVTFPFGDPQCEICGSKLEHIRNVLSSKVKCPRCNGDLNSQKTGYFD